VRSTRSPGRFRRMLEFLKGFFSQAEPESPDADAASPDREFFSPSIPVFNGFDDSHVVPGKFVEPTEVPTSLRKRLRFSMIEKSTNKAPSEVPSESPRLWRRLSLGSDRCPRDSITSTLGVECQDIASVTLRRKARAKVELANDTIENRRYSNALKEHLHREVMDIPISTVQAIETTTRASLGYVASPAPPSAKKPRRVYPLSICAPDFTNVKTAPIDSESFVFNLPELTNSEKKKIRNRPSFKESFAPEDSILSTFLKQPKTNSAEPNGLLTTCDRSPLKPTETVVGKPSLSSFDELTSSRFSEAPGSNIFNLGTSSRRPAKRR
jgi:hypothetical protein